MFRLISCIMMLSLGSHRAEMPCKDQLDLNYIGRTDLIVVARMDDQQLRADGNVFTVIKAFKGALDEQLFIYMDRKNFSFEAGKDYLIYASVKHETNRQEYFIAECSRTSLLADARDDISFLVSKIKCPDERDTTPGACHRIYQPVCGCDNKTYGNPCEARKAGVKVYSPGQCKQ